MVCLGNICRSPLADGILSQLAQEAGLDLIVDSAGTSAYHIDEQPDQRTQENARSHGYDLSHLRARQFTQSDFDEFDYIYAMDADNYNNIKKLARNESDMTKVDLLLNESHPGENRRVPDPYFGGDQGFENVFQMVHQACEVIIKKHQDA